MPTLDDLLTTLTTLLHPLPTTLTTLILLYLSHSTTTVPPTTTTTTTTTTVPPPLLRFSIAYTLLTYLLSLFSALDTWLSNIEGLERDGVGAVIVAVAAVFGFGFDFDAGDGMGDEGHKVGKRRKSKRVIKWDEEIVLVTGGAGGLGMEIVRGCVRRGCRAVAVVDVVGFGEGTGAGGGGGRGGGETVVKGFLCDVGDAAGVEAMAERVRREVCRPEFSSFPLLLSLGDASVVRRHCSRVQSMLSECFVG